MNAQMKMLEEALNYEGVNFVENYLASNLTKAFFRDAEEYGQELAEDMYIALFGEETRDIFSYINENYDSLNEVVNSVDAELLFEGYAEKEILNEAPISAGKSISGAASAAGKAKKAGGVLKGLWDKIKGFGKGALSKLKDFADKGIPWAKEIAQKGASFFANNPIAQSVVPAVAIAGGAAAGWKLIKKLKGKKASKEEYKKALEQKQDKIKKYTSGRKNESSEFHFEDNLNEEQLVEDVFNFDLNLSSVSQEGDEPVSVSAKLYFETKSKDQDKVKEICDSREFKQKVEDIIKEYF